MIKLIENDKIGDPSLHRFWLIHGNVVSVETSRSRDVTVSRRTNVLFRSRLGQNPQRLGGLVSVSGLCVSGFVSVSKQ